jgi:hypothetical protein
MKKLLGDRFPAITRIWGFLEAPYERLGEELAAWHLRVPGRDELEREKLAGRLGELFVRLGASPSVTPATGFDVLESSTGSVRLRPSSPRPPTRHLFTETRSAWTALFSSNPGAPSGTIGYLAKTMRCRGVVVSCTGHTYDPKTNTGIIGGGVHFTLYGSGGQSKSERDIGASFDDLRDRWEFVQYGKPLPFEHVDRYSADNIPDRFTCEMLEEYCLAVGIRLYDEEFYGPRGILLL